MQNTIKIEVPSETSNGDSTPAEPKKDENNPKFKSDLQKPNILSFVYFTYVFPLIIRGFKISKKEECLKENDLFTIPYKRRADVLSDKINENFSEQKSKSLFKAILWTVKWKILKIIFVQTLFLFTRIFLAWVIKKVIDGFVYPEFASNSWKWAAILSLCLVVAFHLDHHYNRLASDLPCHIQNALIHLLYNKITKLSIYSLTKISKGNLLNICMSRVNLFEQVGMYAANVIVSIFALVAGGAVLWQYYGVFSLISLGYIVFWYPFQALVIRVSLKSRNKTNTAEAKRLRTTRETIQGIKLIKMHAWELKFRDKINALREFELKMLTNGSVALAINRGIAFSAQICASFLMTMSYRVAGNDLETGNVFSGYFLIGYLRLYCSYMFSLGLNFLTDARILIKNIQEILETPEIEDQAFDAPLDPQNAVEFENFSGNWNKKQSGPSVSLASTLKEVNLTIKKGSLNALVGTVGSGKTSLLMTLTGEMPKTSGSLRYKGDLAIVEQRPAIFPGTFRDNLCFGKPYDAEFYRTVVKACHLEKDIELLPDGDLTKIGEKGSNLCQSQKARLVLARAVYSQADIYIFDNPLGVVDPKIAKKIYHNAIEDLLKGKTIIMSTHQVEMIKNCDHIIFMEDGRVLGSGSYEELKRQNVEVDKVFGHKSSQAVEEGEGPSEASMTKEEKHQNADNGRQEGVEKEKLKHDEYAPNVTWSTYFKLFKQMGGWKFWSLILVAIITCEMANMGYGRMLGALIADTFDDWITLTVLACFAAYNIIIYITRYLIIGFGLVRAARRYHEKMLDRIIRAKAYFFNTNSVGDIFSRFSEDVDILDKKISWGVLDTVNVSFAIASILITASILNPVLIGPFVGAIIVMTLIFHFCFPAVKQCKLFENQTKDSLFDLLSASISGVTAMRIYKQADAFQHRFKEELHTATKASVSFNLSQRFMTFYIDLTYTIAAIGCVFIITARGVYSTLEEATLAAFSFALILVINALFQFGLKQFTQLSTSIVAVARIQAYLEAPLEPPAKRAVDNGLKAKGWPRTGKIEMNRASMKDHTDHDFLVKDLSLQIEAGQRVGCVARNGGDKSSIIQLLYRLQDLDRSGEGGQSSFIKLDDVNTEEIGIDLLRGSMSIIPQNPFVFTDTIRNNVDPMERFKDEEIWAALEDVKLKDHVESQPKKLDTEIHGGNPVFSAGQKQLICFARSMLKRSKVLVIDEGTAHLDYDTDSFVQKNMEKRFGDATQLTFAHTLQRIANCDKVLVLDKDRKVEFDQPYKLLVKNIGDQEVTSKEGYFADMVKNTGSKSSEKIFNIAKDTYFSAKLKKE